MSTAEKLTRRPSTSPPGPQGASAPASASAVPKAASPAAPRSSVTAQQRMARIGSVLMLQARALSHDRFRNAATAVTTELCTMLGCDRVSVGFYRRQRISVTAVSNTGDFRERQSLIGRIGAAMEEALDQRTTIVHPTPAGTSPKVTLAHAQLSESCGKSVLCTVPITEGNRLLGALLFEASKGFTADAVRLAQDVALFVGPVLALKYRHDASLGRKLESLLLPRGKRLQQDLSIGRRIVLVALLAAVIGAGAWPAPFRITAPARIEGAIERVVAAPTDGFLRAVSARPGQRVKAGEALATLDDRDLALERDKWEAEIAQLDKQYREAFSKDEAASIVIAKAKLDQARTELGLVLERLGRTRLQAPIDGIVIKGDLQQSIGAPVKRGQTLLVIAPENDFRVILEVDEQDVSEVRVGQAARVLFAADTNQPVELSLTRVAPIATARDGRNFFEAEAHIPPAAAAAALRPGLQGVAKIEIEERRLISIWTHRAANWLRRMLWRALA